MDTVTHIVLGACIGEAIAGKQLGKKALFMGAIAQSLPDIDFVTSFWMDTAENLLAHRGFTHSFLFLIIITPLLAWLSGKIFRNSDMTMKHWSLLWGVEIFIHIFIDAFNAYGTGWFEPFSHYRVSFNTMFVADPLFTIWPAIGFAVLLILHRNSGNRKRWTNMALILCTAYLLLGIIFKLAVEDKVKRDLADKGIVSGKHFTTPTPLNNLLWYIVAESDSGYSIGYWSVLDKPDSIDFHFAYRNDSLLREATDKHTLDYLLRFSEGYYAVQKWHDTLVFNDLRFGEILGWAERNPKFVFYYFPEYPKANDLIVQRGRFAGWDKGNIMAFARRIGGNTNPAVSAE